MANIRRRIAVMIGQADEDYQKRFLNGFLEQAFSYDMDACVFSMYKKYQDVIEREKGEANIFHLFNPDKFDGVVFLKDTIQTDGVAEELEERLHDTFKGPVLVIERESDYFDSVYTDGYTSMAAIVRHMIEVHQFTDIAFLNGKRWHPHSKQRLQAFLDEMKGHNIPVDEEKIIYGDFWYRSGEECAEKLLTFEKLPQAVICANDAMAIGLCESLEFRGIKIPDDIAIASYDSTEEGQTSPKTITSALIPAYDCGKYAADYMNNSFEGKETPSFVTHPKVIVGETCGCTVSTMPDLSRKRIEWGTDLSDEGFYSINNTMSEDLQCQMSLEDCVRTIYSYAYQIKGAESFHLCLASEWKNMDKDPGIHVKNEGYSDEMIYAVRYKNNRQDPIVGLDETFDSKEMLPELYADRENPAVFFFTPVFRNAECYGYGAVCYGNTPKSYDDIYRRWIMMVSEGLENTRRMDIIQLLDDEVMKLRAGKFTFGNAYNSLTAEEKETCDLVNKILDENLLTYNFQPIVRVSDGSIYSYEALMRSTTEQFVSPLDIIKYANMQGRLVDVEKATFTNVLKIVEDNKDRFSTSKVFINSIPGVKMESEDYESISVLLSRNSQIVVVELTEEAELEDSELEILKNHLRQMNIEIAVDDYGTGYSNVTNLLRYMPNYVKIDRSLLSEIQNKPQKQHFVREIIGFCHDNNIMALAEGVETGEELQMVIQLGADLIQGYYTGKPSADIVPSIDPAIVNEMVAYHTEYLEGAAKHIYIAGKTNRVYQSTLAKEGYKEIVIGKGTPVYKDVSIIGTPQVPSENFLTIMPSYKGIITLENTYISGGKDYPGIEIGENSDVTLVLMGENIISKGKIHVPKSSSLTIEGDGNLKISLTEIDYYGIGDRLDKEHGDIVFKGNGQISISANGQKGVYIGSGLGGNIRISSGQFLFEGGSTHCVGLGAYYADANIDITNCLFESELSATEGVCIGSIEGNVSVNMEKVFFKSYCAGSKYIGIGTLNGANASLTAFESTMETNIRAGKSTSIGAFEGRTDLDMKRCGLYFVNAGKNALLIGGYNKETYINLVDTNANMNIHTEITKDDMAPEENITIKGGKQTFIINDELITRTANNV